jgi:hypothetical protein
LTDAAGRFEFIFDPLHFSRDDTPLNRPDLILIVFAPEDSLAWTKRTDDGQESVEVRPTSASPLSRILHISALGRGNAGLTEAYLIRLHPIQLERYGISGTEADFFDTLDEEKTVKVQLPSRIRDQARKRAERAKAAKQRATKVFAHFSAVPHAQRQSELFVRDGKSVKEAQERSVVRGIERYLVPYTKQPHAALRLTLSEKDLEFLGLDLATESPAGRGADNPLKVKVKDKPQFSRKLCELTEAKLGSRELITVRNLLD